MRFLKIKETCLYVRDLERARSYYHDLLELPVIDYLPDKHLFLRVGSSVLLCFNPEDSRQKTSPPAHFGGGKQHLAFEVTDEDYDLVREELERKGIAITDRITWKSGKESVYFEDPEGNVLEILPQNGIWD
ncbi:MAG TPA: VOC family protein [Cyclobacteriaceae bacterium]